MLMRARESCLVLAGRPQRHKKAALLLAAAQELDVPVLAQGGDVEESAAAFKALGRRQAVLAAAAASSAIGELAARLLQEGHQVYLVGDLAPAASLNGRMPGGAVVVTAEMVVFEWLGRAGTDAFRRLLPLIK